MKKFLVIILALVVFQKWDSINAFINPPPDYAVEHNGKVLLYATDWCGYCAKARSFLETNNIPYYEYNIEKSRKGRDQYDSLDGNGVPLLLVNGDVIKGYDPNQILKSWE